MSISLLATVYPPPRLLERGTITPYETLGAVVLAGAVDWRTDQSKPVTTSRAFDQDPSSDIRSRMAAEVAVPNPDWRLVVQLTPKRKWVQTTQICSHCAAECWPSKNPERCCVSASPPSKDRLPRALADDLSLPASARTYFGDDRVEEVKRFAEEANGGALSWPLLNGLPG